MGNLPQVDKPTRIPLTIATGDYLMDHHFQGRPVLPAVEAMEALARITQSSYPNCSVTTLVQARFDKFLFLEPGKDHMEALADLMPLANGDLQAELITRTRSPKSTITRTKTHARVIFAQSEPKPMPLPLDLAAAPEGICTTIESQKIYQDLVPFGPAFRNICAPVQLGSDGALAQIQCPDLPGTATYNLLGSPFALDAAFHAACVWGQLHEGFVPFPVSIDQRLIHAPLVPGQRCFARVIPQLREPGLRIFDIWILDASGRLCESALGVHMRDVSGGRLQPPEWITRKMKPDALSHLRPWCQDLAVVELDAVAPFAQKTLSMAEEQRFEKMGDKRSKSFLAARVSLKRIFRRVLEENLWIDPRDINTVCDDSTKPCLPNDNEPTALHCSVSHDNRFAVAVADSEPLGVDVEKITENIVKCGRLYMNTEEQNLVQHSPLGQTETALRVWSIKEAVAKATGMELSEAWHRVRISVIDNNQSRLYINDTGPFTAVHATVDDHLFTLFSRRISPF